MNDQTVIAWRCTCTYISSVESAKCWKCGGPKETHYSESITVAQDRAARQAAYLKFKAQNPNYESHGI